MARSCFVCAVVRLHLFCRSQPISYIKPVWFSARKSHQIAYLLQRRAHSGICRKRQKLRASNDKSCSCAPSYLHPQFRSRLIKFATTQKQYASCFCIVLLYLTCTASSCKSLLLILDTSSSPWTSAWQHRSNSTLTTRVFMFVALRKACNSEENALSYIYICTCAGEPGQ